jgi:hypothetical protein
MTQTVSPSIDRHFWRKAKNNTANAHNVLVWWLCLIFTAVANRSVTVGVSLSHTRTHEHRIRVMLYVWAMRFDASVASSAAVLAALSGQNRAEYKQQQNFRDLLLNRNYVILISTKYMSCYQGRSKLRIYSLQPIQSSSLVAPPYRGEGVWVRQWPWELYQR